MSHYPLNGAERKFFQDDFLNIITPHSTEWISCRGVHFSLNQSEAAMKITSQSLHDIPVLNLSLSLLLSCHFRIRAPPSSSPAPPVFAPHGSWVFFRLTSPSGIWHRSSGSSRHHQCLDSIGGFILRLLTLLKSFSEFLNDGGV